MIDYDDEEGPTMDGIRVSFHEASHACVARALLGPHAQLSVTIKSQTLGSGLTSYGKARTSPRNAIVLAASGRAGEQIVLGLADDNFDGDHSDAADEAKIKQIQRDFGLSDDDVEAARAQARILVRSHAAEIRILAKQLLQAGRGGHKIQ